MNGLFSNQTGRAKTGWVALGAAAGTILLWSLLPLPTLPPPPSPPAPLTNAMPIPSLSPALRVEVRRDLPAPSAEAQEAVEQGRFVMQITHPDESRLIQILANRGGLVLAEQNKQLYVLGPETRTPVATAKILWADYSLQRMWAITSPQSATAIGYHALASDRLYLVMPLAWEKSLAGALESLLSEPITAYTKANLRAGETAAGYLTLTLQSIVHRERGPQTMNQTINGI